MKILKKLLVLLCTGLLIFNSACDKRDDVAPTTLLTKMTTTNADGTQSVTNLEYNNQNKLLKIKNSQDTNTYEVQITYGTDGKVSEELTLQNGVESYKYVYNWTVSSLTGNYWGKNENGDWVESNNKYVSDLNSEGLITKEQWFYKQNDLYIGQSYDLYTWTNGNVEKIEMWNVENRKNNEFKHFINLHSIDMISSGLKSANDFKYGTATYEYDDKQNVFSNWGIINGVEGLNKNNITKITYSFDFQTEQNIYTYTYEYNKKNYPTKRTAFSTNQDGATETRITLYEYTTK